jgi:SAM-dependent methyltransferase
MKLIEHVRPSGEGGVERCRYCGGRVLAWCKREMDFVQCTACGLVYRTRMPTERELEELYSAHYSEKRLEETETEMLSSEASIRKASQYIGRFIEQGSAVLDFGAGTGELVARLRELGVDADGVEYSKKAVEAAEKNYDLKLSLSLEDLRLQRNRKYDIIVALEVVEHLPEPAKVLKKLHALLKPGGKLYLTTPNRAGLKARLKRCRWAEARKPFHLVLFNYSSLRMVLKECGFRSVDYLRFSPLTVHSIGKMALHRVLQLLGLYGGLRVIASKSASAD